MNKSRLSGGNEFHHGIPFVYCSLAEERAELKRHCACPAVADLSFVKRDDGRKLAHGAGAEHFVGAIGVGE